MRMLLLKTWRDLLARKGQFAGLILLVTLGISTYVAFQTGYLDLTASVDKANTDLAFSDFSTVVVGAPLGEVQAVGRVPGVAAVEGRIAAETALDMGDGTQAVARVVGVPVGREARVNKLLIQAGRDLDPNAKDEALLHTKFASETGMKVGDRITLKFGRDRRTLRIVGIVASPEYMYAVRRKGDMPTPREFAILFVPHDTVERLFAMPGTVTDVAVRIDPGADVDRVIDRVEKVLKPYQIIETIKRADQASNFMLGEEIAQNRIMAGFMPLLILAISSSSLFIALSRLVTSQRGEIGLAKALGYTSGQVLLHYLLFSVVIAAAGSVLGFVLGDLMARAIASQYITLLGIPFLDHHVYPSVVGGAVLISTFACVVAGIAPAWRSSRLAPAMAMHADPNVALAGGRVPLIERLLAPLLPRSFTFRIPLRNVFRARRRSLYTILGIAFALVLTVATQSMFDSLDYLVSRAGTFTERWDVMAAYEEPFGADRLAEVRRWDGVQRVQGALMLPVEIRAAGGTHEGLATAMDPGADFHGFEITSGEPVEKALADGGMFMASALAGKLGVKVGDTVSVKTPYRDERTDVVVRAIGTETLGAPAFVSHATARTLLGTAETQYNAMYLHVDPRHVPTIEHDLSDLRGSISVVVKSEMLARFVEMMSFANFYQGILFAFGFAMGFVVIYNTFTANVLERTREIATMRTIGESNGRLAVMVTVENVMLALAGVPLGIWMGMRASDAMYAQFSSEAYTLSAIILPTSVAWIVGAVIIVLLVSEIPPVRRIFRLDLAEATKVME